YRPPTTDSRYLSGYLLLTTYCQLPPDRCRDANCRLSFKTQRASTTVCRRSIEGILNVVDSCSVAGVGDSADVLSVYFAGCYLIPLGVEEAHDDTVSALTFRADVYHVLSSLCEHIGVFDKVFGALFDLIAF